MGYEFKHSLCNEVYDGWSVKDQCKSLAGFGYDGIEIAHFTMAPDPSDISADRRKEWRDVIREEGLYFVGLHWLMVAPAGLHVTTPDEALRKRSWEHIDNLIDLCGDLAGDREDCGVLVFGSPKQRCTIDGATREEATKRYADGLAGVADHAAARKVTVLAEALPNDQCDVLLTLDESVEIIKQVNHPAIQTMFDSHNAVHEIEPHATLVDRHYDYIRHVHVNEMDGQHPGQCDYDFKPVLETLARKNYKGWISAEVFEFSPGAETIAEESINYLKSEIEKLEL
jgi:D-psicose/D-tagatose/L-ribulose 3-epimerase